MALQKFSLEVVQKVQQYIRAQLSLPASEQQPVTDSNARALAVEAMVPASLDALGDLFGWAVLGMMRGRLLTLKVAGLSARLIRRRH